MKELNNIDITHHSTFKLPSKARRHIVLESLRDIESFFTTDVNGISGNYYLAGAGSNTFLSPEVECLVQLNLLGVEWAAAPAPTVIFASEDWAEIVRESVKKYSGLEALAAIPGTVGAAPVQNIGAYGKEFSDVCQSVLVFDRIEKKFKTFLKEECEFGYRSSIFKKNKNRYIIVSVSILLNEISDNVSVPSYPGVADMVKKLLHNLSDNSNEEISEKKITPAIICEAITNIRNLKLPKPHELPNVGSCFENPIISNEKAEELLGEYPDMPVYLLKETNNNHKENNQKKKVSAGWLIEACGLKGKNKGGVHIYDKHALVLTNPEGKGTLEELTSLVSTIKKQVYDKFGIELKLEPNVVS